MKTKYKSFKDERLLEMILAGELTLQFDPAFGFLDPTPTIVTRGRRRQCWIGEGKRNPRYHIKIHSHYEQRTRIKIRYVRTIVKAKLVWMIWNKQLVPHGCQIDHEDEDRFNDSPLNLKLLTLNEHYDKHYEPIPD